MLGILLIIASILLIGLGIFAFISQNKEKQNSISIIENKFNSYPELKFVKKVQGREKSFLICFDKQNKKIAYFDKNRTVIIPYSEIISVELIEDGKTILKKSISEVIGGAIIGGVIAGSVGSIIGGLSASDEIRSKVSRVIVKILVNNSSRSSLEVICFDSLTMTNERKSSIETKGNLESWKYNEGINIAKEITDIITIIIDSYKNN